MNLDADQLKKLGLAAGILFAAYKFGPAPVKAGALAVGAVVLARQVPFLRDVA